MADSSVQYDNYFMICGRCNSRLKTKFNKESRVYLDEATFKEIKKSIKKELVTNPSAQLKSALLRTGCTGLCPQEGVSCMVLKDGVLIEQKTLETFDWSMDDWKAFVKENCL